MIGLLYVVFYATCPNVGGAPGGEHCAVDRRVLLVCFFLNVKLFVQVMWTVIGFGDRRSNSGNAHSGILDIKLFTSMFVLF